VDNTVVRNDDVLRRGVGSSLPAAPQHSLIARLIQLISALTIVSGCVQLVAPGFVLSLVGGVRSAATEHFFSIVGMFMALFGGMLLQAMFHPSEQRLAIFWAGLQKFGASAMVAVGVTRHVFSPMALAIAAFDGLSGCIILWFWRRAGRVSGPPS
jgi:hypothetical protein